LIVLAPLVKAQFIELPYYLRLFDGNTFDVVLVNVVCKLAPANLINPGSGGFLSRLFCGLRRGGAGFLS
jgi:hypothetical protein